MLCNGSFSKDDRGQREGLLRQPRSGSPAAAAGASSGRPAAAEAARAPVAHTRLLQQWCGGQCCLCRSSSDVVLVHAILLVPCIMVLALLLVLEMPLGGFLQGWSQG